MATSILIKSATILLASLALGVTGNVVPRQTSQAGAEPTVAPGPHERPNVGDNVYVASHFGHRPAFSPDGNKLAFMSRAEGNAFEKDFKTGLTELVTRFPNKGFLRVQYLPNRDFFLIGPPGTETNSENATYDGPMEMFVLPRGSVEPVPLNNLVFEGITISVIDNGKNTISFAEHHEQYPDRYKEDDYAIFVAEISYASGKPAIINKREVVRSEPGSGWKGANPVVSPDGNWIAFGAGHNLDGSIGIGILLVDLTKPSGWEGKPMSHG